MPKGRDSVLKKKNRRIRKKIRDNEPVSGRIASIIASKRRRKAGKRRICEGMCFSLPTLEDPFNDRNNAMVKQKLKKKLTPKRGITKFSSIQNEGIEQEKLRDSNNSSSNNCPSKFLSFCLNSMQSAWAEDGLSDDCTSDLLANKWGFNFWKSYSDGSDIFDESGDCACREQIAWVVSVVSDSIVRKEKEGSIIESPYLLFLVHAQEEAAKVRSVCKPLKELGIHTVSIHSGAALAHQVHGLKSCEPEFVISTPERLIELVLLRAIDLSRVSFFVVDGLRSFISSGFEHKVKSVREYISGTPHTIVFGGSCGKAGIELVDTLTTRPTCRLSIKG